MCVLAFSSVAPACALNRVQIADPNILPHVQVDKGAIKFVLQGAHIMCRGLTSPGSKMDTDLPAGAICVSRRRKKTPRTHKLTSSCGEQIVMAEGKENALAVGLLKMSTSEIRASNKGIGIDNVHFLNDGLWNNTKLSENKK
jgi:malignant T-cell-amplified sequence